jgi:peptide subunit release factor 1 (eRF1)
MPQSHEEEFLLNNSTIIESFEKVRRFDRPVLSLYANVNAGQKASMPQAVLVRLKNTLRALAAQDQIGALPQEIEDRVWEYFNSRAAQSRSLALFASAKQLEAIEFELAFLDDTPNDRLEARLGEPFFTPVLVAMNEHEPYAVAFCDRDHTRGFELLLGQAEQAFEAVREPSPGEDQTIDTSKAVPKYIADRGDAAKQLAQEHVVHAQIEFYRECGKRLQRMMSERGLERAILMGPERDRYALLSVLPNAVAERVKALLPSTNGSLPDSKDIVSLVGPKIAQLEAERKGELLDAVRETGVVGVEKTLRALQDGRAHKVVVARSLTQPVYIDAKTDYATTNKIEARSLGDRDVVPVDLMECLPNLAERWGAQVEFITGASERKLIDELSGIGALLRW